MNRIRAGGLWRLLMRLHGDVLCISTMWILAKSFHLSMQGVARSIAAARAEMAKCVLLCANCHAEVEQGLVMLPPTAPG